MTSEETNQKIDSASRGSESLIGRDGQLLDWEGSFPENECVATIYLYSSGLYLITFGRSGKYLDGDVVQINNPTAPLIRRRSASYIEEGLTTESAISTLCNWVDWHNAKVGK